MKKTARILLGLTMTALLTTTIGCSSGGGPGSGAGGKDGGTTGGSGGGQTGAGGGSTTSTTSTTSGTGGGSAMGSGTVHAVFTVGTKTVDSMCENTKSAIYNQLNFWTIACTNAAGDTVSFNNISGTWPTAGDVTSTTGFIISMGANNVGLSHAPKSFDFNVSSADANAHKIAGVATAAWDPSGSEPSGSLTLTFDLTFGYQASP